jgi:hypothetical protein
MATFSESFGAAVDRITTAASTGVSAYIDAWATQKVATAAPSAAEMNQLALTRNVSIGGQSAPLSVWLMIGAAAIAGVWILKH